MLIKKKPKMNDIAYANFKFLHYHALTLIMYFLIGKNLSFVHHPNLRALYTPHTSSGTSVVELKTIRHIFE